MNDTRNLRPDPGYADWCRAQDRLERRGRAPGIRREICQRLASSLQLDSSDVQVDVQGRKVRLSGSVTSEFQRRVAQQIARAVRGVTDIQNDLRVVSRTQL